MDPLRRIPAEALGRLLGGWRSRSSRNLVDGLAGQLRILIDDGRLPVNIRLPSERELAMSFGLSRTTIAGVYGRLRESGHLESRQGSGSWTTIPQSAQRMPVAPWLPGGALPDIDLAHAALPAIQPHLEDAVSGALEELPRYLTGHGYHLYGIAKLREAVAQRFTDRGLATAPSEILITNGAQQAINLVLEVALQAGARVLVDHPTYPGALDAITRRGSRPVPIGFEGTVWDLGAVQESIRHVAPQLMYVVPDCHNPTGASMSEEDRPQVIAMAQRGALPLLIDETLAELRLDGPDCAPLAAFGSVRHSTSITIGSVSKLFWGGLRVGWVRAPAQLISELAGARAVSDMASPVLDQLVAARLFEHIEEIRVLRRDSLRSTRASLMTSLKAHLPEWEVVEPTGGLNLWIDIGSSNASVLSRAASAAGVQITPGSRFGIDGAFERFVRLPFTLEPHVAAEAVERLELVWRNVAEGNPRPLPSIAAI